MLKISDDRIRFTDAYVRKLSLPKDKADHIAWDPDLPASAYACGPLGRPTWFNTGLAWNNAARA